MRTSTTTAIAVAVDVRIRLLWDRLDLLREIDEIGNALDVIELRSGRGAELQAVRQRQQAMRVLVCEQVRILLRWRGKHPDGGALTRQPLAHQSEALLD